MASFDPLPDSVLIWTRLTVLNPSDVVEIHWEVSAAQDFSNVVARWVWRGVMLCGGAACALRPTMPCWNVGLLIQVHQLMLIALYLCSLLRACHCCSAVQRHSGHR